MPRLIPLDGINGEGLFAIVSDEDFWRLIGHKWMVSSNGYVYRNGYVGEEYRAISMQWDVTGCSPSYHFPVDHINRNKLDNRRDNLRQKTKSEDLSNRSLYKNSQSGHKWIYPMGAGFLQRNPNSKMRFSARPPGAYKEFEYPEDAVAFVQDYTKGCG